MKDHNLFIHSTLDVFGKLWISLGLIDAQGGSPVCAAPQRHSHFVLFPNFRSPPYTVRTLPAVSPD